MEHLSLFSFLFCLTFTPYVATKTKIICQSSDCCHSLYVVFAPCFDSIVINDGAINDEQNENKTCFEFVNQVKSIYMMANKLVCYCKDSATTSLKMTDERMEYKSRNY